MNSGTPYFTNSWFEHHIPKWQEILVPRFAGRNNLRFLEIGSYEGQSAIWTVENLLTGDHCTLFCVDPFIGAVGENYHNLGENYGRLADRYYANTTKHARKICTLEKTSRDFFISSPPIDSWDMVYIDGSHIAKDVLFDILHAWPQMKDGGIMVIDDYGWRYMHSAFIPRPAIDAFLICYQDEYELLDIDYQVIVQKKKQVIPTTINKDVYTLSDIEVRIFQDLLGVVIIRESDGICLSE